MGSMEKKGVYNRRANEGQRLFHSQWNESIMNFFRINNMTENELFEMFLSEEGGNANCLYDSVAQRAMLRHLDPSDVEVAMQILMDEVVRAVCKWFLDFGGDFLLIIARKLNINFSKAEISDLPSIRMLSLPYFVKQ